MSQKRLSMRKIRDVLRLKYGLGRSHREIAAILRISHSTVGSYVRRAREAGVSWPLPDELDEGRLEAALYPPMPPSRVPRPEPDWARVHRELSRHKGVTLQLLWLEYREAHPDGYQYSRFCDRYREWRGRLDVVLRQVYRAGEKVDHSVSSTPFRIPASTRTAWTGTRGRLRSEWVDGFVGIGSFRPRLFDSALSGPLRTALRHVVRCDEYKPSRRRSRPTSPGSVHRSASSTTRSLYDGLNRRRVGLSTTSASGAAAALRLPSQVSGAIPFSSILSRCLSILSFSAFALL